MATTVAKEMVQRGHNVTILVDDKFLEQIRNQEDSKLFKFVSFKPEFTTDDGGKQGDVEKCDKCGIAR